MQTACPQPIDEPRRSALPCKLKSEISHRRTSGARCGPRERVPTSMASRGQCKGKRKIDHRDEEAIRQISAEIEDLVFYLDES